MPAPPSNRSAGGAAPAVALAVVGPTASGKSALGIRLARRLGGEILSIDSRQIYRRLDVGTAKVPLEERLGVPHHLYDLIDPDERLNANDFGRVARQTLEEVRERGRVPVLVGGSGFYLRAVERGFFDARLDPGERSRFADEVASRSTGELYRDLVRVDPATASRVHPNDRYRIQRALEVEALTGKPLSRHHAEHRPAVLPLVRIGLWPGREALHRTIEERTERMLESGWVEETNALLTEGLDPATTPGLQTLGYPEVVAFIEKRLTRGEARERIARDTRHYARRQMTWFRSEPVTWCDRVNAAEEEGMRLWVKEGGEVERPDGEAGAPDVPS
jgi:tRNA dimethylallyltransferase